MNETFLTLYCVFTKFQRDLQRSGKLLYYFYRLYSPFDLVVPMNCFLMVSRIIT